MSDEVKCNDDKAVNKADESCDRENGVERLLKGLYCCCIDASSCRNCGKPMSTQSERQAVMKALLAGDTMDDNHCQPPQRPPLSNVFGNGPLLVSHVPESAQRGKNFKEDDGVIVGIDEAGRGSVMGPMVYAAAYWRLSSSSVSSEELNIPKGFQDSKALTDEVRSKLLDQLLGHPHIGFVVRVLLPNEISRNMLRPEPYNLNQMSHDSAMGMIHKLTDQACISVRTCYIDTVGNENSYKRTLERNFPTVQFVVETKADAKYAVCSAASVVAKVVRDRMMEGWQFSEPDGSDVFSTAFGSGYPSDDVCKKWFDNVHDPLFGYANVVRFSWAPIKNRLKEQGVGVTFRADVDEDEFQQQASMSAYLGKHKKRKRLSYFEKRNLKLVNDLA